MTMSKVVNASFSDLPTPAGTVPDKKKHLKRYPFVLLIDISGSTGTGSDPDIGHINDAIAKLIDKLLNPPASTELAHQVDQIDVALITYSDKPTIEIPWSITNSLPASIPPFKPLGTTATGVALEKALSYIGDRLRDYKDTKNYIPSGLPHIIHLTDGAPTDMKVGDQRWREIQAKLGNLQGTERQIASILHFVSPNGCMSSFIKDETGNDITGQQALAKLSGAATVFEMGKEVQAFEQLIRLVTGVMTKITQNFGAADAAEQAARDSHGHIKPTEND
jgi:uncharacterized protein YegL